MDKLELKHLAPYLPYDLKLIGKNWDYKIIQFDMECGQSSGGVNINSVDGEIFKPILRPLSDLTEFHIVNIDFTMGGLSAYGILRRIQENPKQGNFNMLEFLYQNHFDVFGLIEKNLAININTLTK
jgi:hypothetical protein